MRVLPTELCADRIAEFAAGAEEDAELDVPEAHARPEG